MADTPTDTDESSEEQHVDFPIPEGFQPPEGTKQGDEFQALATLKVDEDGDLCLLALDGAEVKPESEEEEGNEDQGGMMDKMRQALPGTGMPA
jgi:hypothetical protein